MSPRFRSTFTYLVIVAVVFAGALVASFVYTHEPQRDTLTVTVSDTPARPSAERTVGGTVTGLDAATLQLHTDAGDVSVPLVSGLPVLDLVRVPAAGADPFAPGTPVNVGGEQTSSGLVVSGVVAVEAKTP